MKVVLRGFLAVAAILTTALTTLSLGSVTYTAQASSAGANLPYQELYAAKATTNGAILGPSRAAHTLAGEATGRMAVQLTSVGQYVEFTLSKPANSIVLRYSIPDSADGNGLTAPLSLYVNGARQTDLILTSHYAWRYGWYPFSNNPGDGRPFQLYDEVHRLTGQMAAGSKVRFQVDAGDTAPSYTIDIADFEQVGAPIAKPDGYLSVTDYGADPTGAQDSTTAIRSAVTDGMSQGKGVYIPQGTYTLSGQIQNVDHVTIQGAGMWYTTLHFTGTQNNDEVGVFGHLWTGVPSQNVILSDFAIQGEINQRVDWFQTNGIGGAFSNSIIKNIWIEHTKVGIWLDGAMDNLDIDHVRIRDVMADGLNFHIGVTNSTVHDSNIRNTGDDGMAMWSDTIADANDVFNKNTVQDVTFANDIAIYGGHDNRISNNLIMDGTLQQGGGIHVGNRFGAVPLSGVTDISGNQTVRSGTLDPNWQFGVGALWFFALDSDMTGTINVSHNEFDDSSYEAIMFIGSKITNVNFKDNAINGTGTFALQIQSAGGTTFTGVNATGVGSEYSVGSAIYSCYGPGFTITDGGKNSSWINDKPYCGAWPGPMYGPPPTATPTMTPTVQPPTNTPGGPTLTPTPFAVDINAGGSSASPYVADTDFDSGNVFSDTSTAIDTSKGLDSNPAPQAVYQSVRWNSAFTYTIPSLTPGATYTVRLHWAELTWQAAGQRLFNVAINGTPVLTSFDVFAAAGYKEAISKSFTTTADSTGKIAIAFTQGGADNPFISGIEVTQ